MDLKLVCIVRRNLHPLGIRRVRNVVFVKLYSIIDIFVEIYIYDTFADDDVETKIAVFHLLLHTKYVLYSIYVCTVFQMESMKCQFSYV